MEEKPAAAETPESPPAFVPTGLESAEAENQTIPEEVSWSASEFIAHDKAASWYLELAAGTAVLAALVYLLTRDFISVGVIIVAALIMGVYGGHKPRQLQYRLTHSGLTIGDKKKTFEEFKSFTMVPEGAFMALVFMPLKRFSPSLTVYFAPADQEKILTVLTNSLPYEEPRRDLVDNLMRRIRF